MIRRAGLWLLLAACAFEPRPSDPREPHDPGAPHGAGPPRDLIDATMAVMLTASAPRQDWPIAPFSVAPTAVTLAIAAIDNPSAQAFSLTARLRWTPGDGRATTLELRSVTPYPPSQPGSFLITVPEPIRALLTRSDGRLVLGLALQPIAADLPLAEPLRVTLDEPTWR